MQWQPTTDQVDDPVAHISISGIHGRDELEDRLDAAAAAEPPRARRLSLPSLLAGAAVGAVLMYLFDPARGRRRRALVRDRVVHAAHTGADRIGKSERNVTNRARGLVAEIRGHVRRDTADDPVIADRVRSAMGHVVSHPASIIVAVSDANVTLSGPILAGEVERLLDRVRDVRGVRRVLNQLDAHSHADNIPGLQDAIT